MQRLFASDYFVFFCALFANFLLFFGALNAGYFADDYQFLLTDSQPSFLSHFVQVSSENQFYRPFQSILLHFVQEHFGTQTWPIHVFHLLLHSVLVFIVYKFTLSLGFKAWQRIITVVFLLVSQANVHAIVSVDTTSMLGSTTMGFLSCYFLFGFYEKRTTWYFVLSILAFLFSLFFKESGVSFLFILVLLIVIGAKRFMYIHWKRKMFHAIIFVFAFLFYITLRIYANGAAVQFVQGTYGFNLGLNIPINYLYLIVASTIPISSAHIFKWFVENETIYLFLSLLLLVPYYVFLLYFGIKQFLNQIAVRILFGFYMLGLVPVVFLNHVSELYTYNSMPFLGIIVGYLFGQFHFLLKNKKYIQWVYFFWAAILILNICSVHVKSSKMLANGKTSKNLENQVKTLLKKLPKNSCVYLINSDNQTEYSVFFINDFNLFKNGLNVFYKEVDSLNLKIAIINQPSLKMHQEFGESYFFRISGNNRVEEFTP